MEVGTLVPLLALPEAAIYLVVFCATQEALTKFQSATLREGMVLHLAVGIETGAIAS